MRTSVKLSLIALVCAVTAFCGVKKNDSASFSVPGVVKTDNILLGPVPANNWNQTPTITWNSTQDLKYQARVLRKSDGQVLLDWTGVTSGSALTLSTTLDFSTEYVLQLRPVLPDGTTSDDLINESPSWKTAAKIAHTQKQKLVSSPAIANGSLGNSVALDATGSRVVVGVPFAAGRAGDAFVYVKNAGVWTQEAELTPADRLANDYVGLAVDMNDAGDLVVLGANGADVGGSNRGAAYVYRRNGSVWSLETKLLASDAADGNYFGADVKITGDGERIVVGAYGHNGGTGGEGAIYVYRYENSVWNEEAILQAVDRQWLDYLGLSVAVDDRGERIVGGSYYNDGKGQDSGAAYVFERSGTSWSQTAKLYSSDIVANDKFGIKVGISGDGKTIAATSVVSNSTKGSVYAFRQVSGAWSEIAILRSSLGQSLDQMGESLALSDDGTRIASGSRFTDSVINNSGSVFYFIEHVGGAWTEQPEIKANDPGNIDYFGMGLSLSDDGSVMATGATKNDQSATNAGAVYIFE